MVLGFIKKRLNTKTKGFKDDIFNFVFGRLPYRVNRFIRENGHKRIESITIYRAPIMSVIDKLFNILSLGKFDEAKNKLGYDDLFHLYIIVQFNDDSRAIIEKNQDINIDDDIKARDTAESYKVDMGGRQPTLNELLENTRREMGDNNFYGYDAFKNNCQDFIYYLIKSNGFLTNDNQQFIKQNAGELLKSLPSFSSSLSNKLTSAGSYVNRFLQGLGFKGFEEGGLII